MPEGIVFQSQTAYKDIRKMLVENSLVAVVSLPAGVFNPYSGVKTSILILDKSLAKHSDSVAFFKIENDGFGLGAQRRANAGEQLTQVKIELAEYLELVRSQQATDNLQPTLGLIVPKEKIAENGDYNLSGERYREAAAQSTHFPWRKVESLIDTITPPSKIQKTAFGLVGRFPILDQSQDEIAGWTDDESALVFPSKPLVIFGDHTCVVKLVETPFAQGADGIKILQTIEDLNPKFLFHLLRAKPLESDGYQRHFSKLKEHQIPLPPLDVQKEIVAEIEGYQKVINGARAVLDHYRPHIHIHPDWPMPTFEDAPFEIVDGDRGPNYPSKEDLSPLGYCLFLNTKNVRFDGFKFENVEFISAKKDQSLRKGKLERGDVLLTTRGTIGNTALYDASVEFEHIRINSGMLIFRPDATKLSSSYLFHFFQSDNFRLQREAIVSGAAQPQLPIRSLNEAKIPLPFLAIQQSIVAEIEAEQALVSANRELIVRFEKKIQATLARVWGEEEQSTVDG